jgi:uracil-DNA glycosylase
VLERHPWGPVATGPYQDRYSTGANGRGLGMQVARCARMATRSARGRETAAPLVPPGALSSVRKAALGCRACDLWTLGTQTVFGVGPAHAEVMIVGETPGDQEDREGEPFVGPAGKLLDAALTAAGIDRSAVYLTNVVKHFKWKRVGKSERRIHQKPSASEIAACRPWLDAEIRLVKPRVLVCLGSTAAQALLGRAFRVTEQRGVPVESPLAPIVIATVHPASVLRAPDSAARRSAGREFFADIGAIGERIRRDAE